MPFLKEVGSTTSFKKVRVKKKTSTGKVCELLEDFLGMVIKAVQSLNFWHFEMVEI